MYRMTDINAIKDYMLMHNETIAVAESVTSGLLQAAFSQPENATKFFQGGITAYNLGQKFRHLNVEPIHANSCNCVSEKIAGEMAREVCRVFSSDWGVSVTGYAAAIPELNIDDLFAFYSIAFSGEILVTKRIETERPILLEAQLDYVDMIIADFVKLLLGNTSHLNKKDKIKSNML